MPQIFYAAAAISAKEGIINTLRSGQNGGYFADKIFKRIFLKENLFQFKSHWVRADNSTGAEVMTWYWKSDKPLP